MAATVVDLDSAVGSEGRHYLTEKIYVFLRRKTLKKCACVKKGFRENVRKICYIYIAGLT